MNCMQVIYLHSFASPRPSFCRREHELRAAAGAIGSRGVGRNRGGRPTKGCAVQELGDRKGDRSVLHGVHTCLQTASHFWANAAFQGLAKHMAAYAKAGGFPIDM